MAQREFSLATGTEYPAAFEGIKVQTPFPDRGTDEKFNLSLTGKGAESVANILRDAGWDGKPETLEKSAERAMGVYISASVLQRQKNVKAKAGDKAYYEPLIVDGKLKPDVVESVAQTLQDVANEAPVLTPREWSEGGGVKTATVKEKGKAELRAELVAKAKAKAEAMSPAARARYVEQLAELDIHI